VGSTLHARLGNPPAVSDLTHASVTIPVAFERIADGAYDEAIARTSTPTPKKVPEPTRVERIRRDAARPMSVNLAEGIALSHKLIGFVGAARER
jgi:hypothetical protein